MTSTNEWLYQPLEAAPNGMSIWIARPMHPRSKIQSWIEERVLQPIDIHICYDVIYIQAIALSALTFEMPKESLDRIVCK